MFWRCFKKNAFEELIFFRNSKTSPNWISVIGELCVFCGWLKYTFQISMYFVYCQDHGPVIWWIIDLCTDYQEQEHTFVYCTVLALSFLSKLFKQFTLTVLFLFLGAYIVCVSNLYRGQQIVLWFPDRTSVCTHPWHHSA